jgi:hypothetical protein
MDPLSADTMHNRYGVSNVVVTFFPYLLGSYITKTTIAPRRLCLLLTGIKQVFAEDLLFRLSSESFFDSVVISAGRNPKLFALLQSQFDGDNRYHWHTFYDFRAHYHEIDIMIAKCGGALTAECIATDTPLIVPALTPGQEEGNRTLLESYDIGFFEPDPAQVIRLLRHVAWSRMPERCAMLKKVDGMELLFDGVL